MDTGSFSLMAFLEFGLLILLSVGLVYMVSINKKLKMLKSGGDGFKAVVIELNHATENAKTAIQGLKLTVRDAEHGLDGNLKQARSVTEELKYLLNQAENYSNGLQNSNARNIPAPSENLRKIRQPVVRQNRAKNFADQTLEKVAQRKQSLPNPIVHSQENNLANRRPSPNHEQDLGQNIPTEHREMALQAREQALKSIAAKNIEQNKQRPVLRPMSANRSPNQARGQLVQPAGQPPVGRRMPVQGGQLRPQMEPPRTEPPRANPQGQMSLSDMVGRHAEMERQNFAEAGAMNRTAKSETTANGGGNKRQSLFQKLSKTR